MSGCFWMFYVIVSSDVFLLYRLVLVSWLTRLVFCFRWKLFTLTDLPKRNCWLIVLFFRATRLRRSRFWSMRAKSLMFRLRDQSKWCFILGGSLFFIFVLRVLCSVDLAEKFENVSSVDASLTPDVASELKTLWLDPSIQKVWKLEEEEEVRLIIFFFLGLWKAFWISVAWQCEVRDGECRAIGSA